MLACHLQPNTESSIVTDSGIFMNPPKNTRNGRCVAPRVGVVITNYNNASYVEDAIGSAFRQTIHNLQVIVVDDHSTDNSNDIIRTSLAKLNDSRFQYVRLTENGGQAAAIRKGLALLDTPFVCFLDSDDYWYDDFINRHLSVHLNSDFPVGLTYCDSHIVDEHAYLLAGTAWWFDHNLGSPSPRTIQSRFIPAIDPEAGDATFYPTNEILLHLYWTPEWASNSMTGMMFRRSFVDLVLKPADADLRLYVDFYLSTLAALLTGAIAIPEALYAYRMHGDNKHSNGMVLGGTYNTSQKPWEPIRDRVLNQVLQVLQNDSALLRRVFGVHRHEQALASMRSAVGARGKYRSSKALNKLQKILSR